MEIKGDDQLSGHQQWLMKNMTTEMEPRKSFSKVSVQTHTHTENSFTEVRLKAVGSVCDVT